MTTYTPADLRFWIAVFAGLQVGSHYLWGTAGNTLTRGPSGELMSNPDGFTSVKRRTAIGLKAVTGVPPARKPTAARECWGVEAAFSTTGGEHVCTGRFQSVPMGQVATYFSNPARANKLLATYLEYRNSGKPYMIFAIEWMMKNWQNLTPDNPPPQDFFAFLTPRIGYATVDAVGPTHQQLIWGESCDGMKHFDCVGLINASHAVCCGWPEITFEIWQWAGKGLTQQMAPGTPILPGDIVCDFKGTVDDAARSMTLATAKPLRDAWHHIGICLGDPAGTIIQAEQGPVGVTAKPGLITAGGTFPGGGFNYRGRLPDSTLAAWRKRGDKELEAANTRPAPRPVRLMQRA